ncbi:MAG: hypothetical protein H7X91_06350, partial [Burkholderiales bacterium]|nr:hypothetical protein [Burkholderiales bacterium]
MIFIRVSPIRTRDVKAPCEPREYRAPVSGQKLPRARSKLPNLSFVRFPHDHFGNFKTAKFGVNTPDTQMADNDYAT